MRGRGAEKGHSRGSHGNHTKTQNPHLFFILILFFLFLCGGMLSQEQTAVQGTADQFATKAMTVAVAPWLIVRVIDRNSAKTIYEHAVHLSDKGPPSATPGNRVMLYDQRGHGFQTIGTLQRNLDLLTVFILPENHMTDDRTILLMVILNQIEIYFMLYRVGCLNPVHQPAMTKLLSTAYLGGRLVYHMSVNVVAVIY